MSRICNLKQLYIIVVNFMRDIEKRIFFNLFFKSYNAPSLFYQNKNIKFQILWFLIMN